MKILFVSIGGPPKSNAESLQISKVMSAFLQYPEIQLTWLTGHVAKKSEGWELKTSNFSDILKVIEIIELGKPNTLKAKIINRFNPDLNFKSITRFYLKAIDRLLKQNKVIFQDFDIIYSRSSPIYSAIIADKIKSVSGLPWINHMSDPWAYSPLNVPDQKKEETEKQLIRNSDFLYLTNKNALYWMQDHHDIKAKSGIFPNVYSSIIENTSWQDRSVFRIIHTGNFYESRSPLPLLKALSQVAGKDKNFELHLVGFMTGKYQSLMEQYKNDFTIIEHGGVAFEQAEALQQKAHLLISIDPELRREEAIFLPSKLIDYMAKQIPVIALGQEDSPGDILIRQGYGRSHRLNEIDKITGSILFYYDLWSNNNPLQLAPVNTSYSAHHQVGKLIETIKKLKHSQKFHA